MRTYNVIRVSNQNTSFDVIGGDVGISKDKNGSYVIINDKKIYGLSRIEHICQVKVVNEKDEKQLKALEIIKKYFKLESYYGKVSLESKKEIPQEEYDLLKEMLL